METANCRLTLDKIGSDIPLKGITPAQYVVLVKIHQDAVGRCPITDLKVEGTVVTTNHLEKSRLLGMYKHKIVNGIYPGDAPALPTKFSEVVDKDIKADPKDVEIANLRAQLELAKKQATGNPATVVTPKPTQVAPTGAGNVAAV